MNDEEKFRLKLKLIVGLCTAKDIQDWAEATISKDIRNEFALNICFIESADKIEKYFIELNPQLLNIDTEKSALSILKAYLQKKLPQKLDAHYEHNIHNLIFLSEYLHDISNNTHEASLYGHIIAYDDEITYLTQKETIPKTAQRLYLELYNYLESWIESVSKD